MLPLCMLCDSFCIVSLFYGAGLSVFSSLAIILLRKRDNWLLCFNCVMAVCVMCLFNEAPWVVLLSVSVEIS